MLSPPTCRLLHRQASFQPGWNSLFGSQLKDTPAPVLCMQRWQGGDLLHSRASAGWLCFLCRWLCGPPLTLAENVFSLHFSNPQMNHDDCYEHVETSGSTPASVSLSEIQGLFSLPRWESSTRYKASRLVGQRKSVHCGGQAWWQGGLVQGANRKQRKGDSRARLAFSISFFIHSGTPGPLDGATKIQGGSFFPQLNFSGNSLAGTLRSVAPGVSSSNQVGDGNDLSQRARWGRDLQVLLVWVDVVVWMKMVPIGSCIWTLRYQLVNCLGRIRKYAFRSGLKALKAWARLKVSLFLLSVDQDVNF